VTTKGRLKIILLQSEKYSYIVTGTSVSSVRMRTHTHTSLYKCTE